MRELILHRSLIPKVIPVKLFLGMVPVLSRMLLTRCVDVFVKDLFMFRFVSFESEENPQTL